MLIVIGLALAQAPTDAERAVHEAEIEKLAAKGAWDGVERELAKLADPGPKALLAGADAARVRGDVGLALERLRRAGAAERVAEIEAAHAKVTVPGPGPLAAETQPFNPDHAAAIRFAAAKLASDGRFSGWLPLGRYTVGDKRLEVTPEGPKWLGDALPASAPRKPAPVALGIGAGLAGGAAVAFYTMALTEKSAWQRANTAEELDVARRDANRLVAWSALSAGVAVGFGTGAVIAGRF